METKGYLYAKQCINEPSLVPKYVLKQCEQFIETYEGKSEKYTFNFKTYDRICKLLKCLKMPKGLKVGQSLYDCLAGFQWLLIEATLCIVYRDDEAKRRYEKAVLEICRKNGKMLSLDTPIPTPNGWKTMGDIHTGDIVFSSDGKPTNVLYESEIRMKPMYNVEFEDGEVITACGEHLWTVKTKKAGYRELMTEDMVEDFVRVRKDGKGNEYKYRVPMSKPVQYSEKEQKIKPYTLGVWLADGNCISSNITEGNEDYGHILYNIMKDGYYIKCHNCKDRANNFSVLNDIDEPYSKRMYFLLKEMDLINNKHIPVEYLQGSIKQRTELLKGIMDADGYVSKRGQCEIIQKSKVLAENILELLCSLGIKATMKEKEMKIYDKSYGTGYRIQFFVDKEHSCFKLKRKHERLKEHLADRMSAKSITNIYSVKTVPAKCIMVDNPSHQYLCGKHFTVTHNTFIIAVLFILLMFLEPKFSYLYSVAPDGSLSREIKKAMEEIIGYNEAVLPQTGKNAMMKLRRDDIMLIPKQNKYIPLNYSNSRLDGRLPNVFLIDEAGALPNSYAIEAMQSGQLTIKNKLGFVISTKYPTIENPFEDEVSYAKKVLDGTVEDETLFALLYEPDNTKEWQTDDVILLQPNPLAQEIPEILDDLYKKRERAIAMPSARENFLTKHCNIIYQGLGTNFYIAHDDLANNKVETIDWEGRNVFVGVDLAQTGDNCAVSIASYDKELDRIYFDSVAFIPADKKDEKSKTERVNYDLFMEQGHCIACGTSVVDYAVIEQFVFDIEKKYGVKIQGIGYDRYNCMSSAQKWSDLYTTVEIRQNWDTLHQPTKLLKEYAETGRLAYTDNKLFEINMANAQLQYDANMNMYVNKKKSYIYGKIDMVTSLINAVYLVNQEILMEQRNFVCQII